jgi:tetratricopeptide (TPR) repeat protein
MLPLRFSRPSAIDVRSYLKRLLGKKEPEPVQATQVPSSDPAKDPNMIRAFDGYGREMFITKQQWREGVLPGILKKAWNQPDELYNIIVSTLNDGFRSDVIGAAKHLYKFDPDRSRAACLWGVVLMEEGRLDAAKKIFSGHIGRHGEDGFVLTNLAKVYARQNNDTKAEEILWHALEVDPNQENGVRWYEVIHRERGGEVASHEALLRIAGLPGSWRAQLWLARAALKERQLHRALTFYRECLSRVTKPVPADVLMQISGDLGNAGHLPESLDIAEPLFDPAFHGVQVGNNLIKAHCDLGQFGAARSILDQLYALKRPDWRETLSFWDTELAKTRVELSPSLEEGSIQMAMLTIEGPVWLRPDSPATELFPAKLHHSPRVSLVGSSAEQATHSKRSQHQLADTQGRLSRALPLFFAEQLEFSSAVRPYTLIPWVSSGCGAFVLSAVRWSDEDAANYARQGEEPSDYVVIVHLKSQFDPWTAEVRFVRTIDVKCLAQFSGKFSPDNPATAVSALADRLLAAVASELETHSPTPLYDFPTGAQFPFYLLRLEQLLATRCATMEGAIGFLSSEREIIDGDIQLCVESPNCIPARVLLAQTLLAMRRVRPDILPEFREKLVLLQKKKPLQEPSHTIVQRIIDQALAD